jgi:hypothetical protein
MAEPRKYHVYVVELERRVCEKHGCPAQNDQPPLYVGQSAHPPTIRFTQHKDGYKSSRVVRNFGVRLRSRLSKGFGPYGTRAEALDAEVRLAKRLAQQGFCVFGGH